jgi:NAD(P)-dependent dehydrogenase (short-subunit alcohol dehydrogenase family)
VTGVNLDGKTAVVTGPTSGIGKGTALALAKLGATVVLVARSPEKCAAVADAVRTVGPEPVTVIADLSLLTEAKRAADDILHLDRPIDILINNAGLVNQRRTLTPEGLEQTMAVNYFAPFAMTLKLLPALRRAEAARIVNVTSNSYAIARLNFDDLTFARFYWPLGPYSASKLGNIYFSRQLAKRLDGTRITVNAVHPGLIFTNLGLGNNPGPAKKVLGPIWRLFAKDESEGHEGPVHAATSPELEQVTGQYIADCRVRTPKRVALREGPAQRLWEVSERVTGVTFDGPSAESNLECR